jgi:predicted small lipoprotein YifL
VAMAALAAFSPLVSCGRREPLEDRITSRP